jgi:GxxExxY protein
MEKKYKYQDLTHEVIGAAMEVHRHLGNGFQELVSQRALSIEPGLRNIQHDREKEMPLEYNGHDIGTGGVGFLSKEKLCWKLKQ